MMQYSFILKDNNQKAYRGFTWFLFFLHLVAAGVLAFNMVERNTKLSLYILATVYVLAAFIFYFFRERKKTLETFSMVMAVLYAGFWLKYAGVIALLIFTAVYFFVRVVQQKKTTAGFSSSGVHIKRVFKTITIPWQELDNVILKDGLLTIDLRSNKIIQSELLDENGPVDEKAFNLFCHQQLKNKD